MMASLPPPDEHLQPYIDALPPAPHNSVVLITSLSEPTLRSLFDLASPSRPPSPSPPTKPPIDNPPEGQVPGRHPRHHGLVWRTVAYMVNLAFWAAVLVGLGYGGQWVAKKWRERRTGGGAVALPDDEVHVDIDSDEE